MAAITEQQWDLEGDWATTRNANAQKDNSLKRQVAEREGFEPSRRLPAYTLSRRAPSTTRPSLRIRGCPLGAGLAGRERRNIPIEP